MTLKILRASTMAFILFTGCTLLGKKTERTPQGGIKSAFKLFVKAGNQAAEALRRGEKDMKGKNLQGVHLKNMDLSDADFRYADLEQARLQETIWSGAKAQGANFKKARCQGADFRGAKLREDPIQEVPSVRAIFKKARLQKAKMSDLDLKGLDFRGANLKETDLQRAMGDDADFREANLTETNMLDSNVHRADFRGANLKGTKLKKAKMYDADFREAKNLDEAEWKGAYYSLETKFPEDFNPKKHGLILHLEGADLQGQYIGDLDLENATFWWKANLEGATYKLGQKFPEGFNPIKQKMEVVIDNEAFKFQNTHGVNFWNSDVGKLDLRKRDLRGADLSQINYPHPDEALLEGANYDLNTKFPDGFEPKAYGMEFHIRKVDLQEMNLGNINVDLRGVDFGGMDLEGVDLRGKNLHGANLQGVRNLKTGQLEGAYWDYNTKFPASYNPEGRRLSLRNFRDYILRHKLILDLRGKDLRDALTKVEGGKGYRAGQMEPMHDIWLGKFLQESESIVMDLDGADLRGLDFSSVRLKNALNLHKAQLEGAIYDYGTDFPEGFNPEEYGMRLAD